MEEEVAHHVPKYPGRERVEAIDALNDATGHAHDATGHAEREPTTIERKADEMKALFAKKNADYAGEAGTYANFTRAAVIAEWFDDPVDRVFATLLGIKLARLATLKRKGKTPNFESVEDTHEDFKTYAAIWEAWEIDRKAHEVAWVDHGGPLPDGIGSSVPTHAL